MDLPLSVEGLAKTWRGPLGRARHVALRGVSFAVGEGRILGLIGPNGAGKTTAIRCALGLVRASRGEVRIFGARPLSIRARRHVGFAPEFFDASASRTGAQTLELFGALSGLDRDARRKSAVAMLERFGLAEAADRRVGSWSKGMRRRLAIAQALLGDPRLVVLDEPFDGLDPLGALLVREEIVVRARAGAAILMSSHQLADVEAVATDLVVLHHGSVVSQGVKEAVLDRPGVARFEFSGLDAAGRAEIEAEIARRGGAVLASGAARESLEDLFRRLVKPDAGGTTERAEPENRTERRDP